MQQSSYTEKIIFLANQKGLIRPSDLDELEIPRIYLTRLTASGELQKVGRGLYKLPNSMLSENELGDGGDKNSKCSYLFTFSTSIS
ncbi:MAG: type IV toxin-antitoxin system AbiEi family antitoxin domain-containing protein [Methylotenera sp.]|nr:type IV toxin-antitoxin system AbiEi family antitoxin domain-containing protein [Methylotenera sp.]